MQILTEVEENMIEGITADDHDPEIEEDRDLEIANAQDLEKVENVLDQDLENHLGKNLKKIMIPKKVPPRIGILLLDQNPALVKVVKSKVIAK